MAATSSCVSRLDWLHQIPDLIVGLRDVGFWFIRAGLAWRLRFLVVSGFALSLYIFHKFLCKS